MQMLLSIESIFMTAAAKFDASAIENKFNTLIEKGIENVSDMEAWVLASCNPLELELIANFKEFVYLCIDVKKKNAAVQQQQQLEEDAKDKTTEQPQGQTGDKKRQRKEKLPINV